MIQNRLQTGGGTLMRSKEALHILESNRYNIGTILDNLDLTIIGRTGAEDYMRQRVIYEFGKVAYEKSEEAIQDVGEAFDDPATERYNHSVVVLSNDEAQQIATKLRDLDSRLESINQMLERGDFDEFQ